MFSRFGHATVPPIALRPHAERLPGDAETAQIDLEIVSALHSVKRALAPGLRRLDALAEAVIALEDEIAGLSDGEIQAAFDDARGDLGEKTTFRPGLIKVFALAREVTYRHLGFRHRTSQIKGAGAMWQGAMAEIATGEGKTVTALMAACALALRYPSVHVLTVNEYLAERDFDQLKPLYAALGLEAAYVNSDMDDQARRDAYGARIVYCTQQTLVFDYLRDRVAVKKSNARGRSLTQRLLRSGVPSRHKTMTGLFCALVDEGDGVLIDEARTPFILSGPDTLSPPEEVYGPVVALAREMREGVEFKVEQGRAVKLLDAGAERAEPLQDRLPSPWCARRAREELLRQAIRAVHMLERDGHYMVADDKVVIIDESTGRAMPDRSWSDGLHQCVEVKEGLAVTDQNKTMGQITFQRFFPRYQHLCGMTGTAAEVAGELAAVYGLRVLQIPTAKPPQRAFLGAQLYTDAPAKWQAIGTRVQRFHEMGRPVLVGTRSVAASEELSAVLGTMGIIHRVLNARQDAGEADLVGQAGERGAVTIATNMAGRGTDIPVPDDVEALGGLHVILTEYHGSPRVDRQLFGRAGRKGQKGSAETVTALTDEVFQQWGGLLPTLLRPSLALLNAIRLNDMTAEGLRRFCQWRSERKAASERIAAVANEAKQQRSVAFSGTEI